MSALQRGQTRTGIEVAPEACAREIMETVPQVLRFVRTEMRRHASPQLSVPQFRVLAYLGRMPGASLSDVAGHLGVTSPTASAMVDRLVRRGLVERAQHPDERRRVVLRLTEAGSALLERARALTRARVAQVLATLSESDLRRLGEGLAALRRAFELQGGVRDGG
ncbi:MAG: MarR family transcriptional regulator [Bacillota bacterium]